MSNTPDRRRSGDRAARSPHWRARRRGLAAAILALAAVPAGCALRVGSATPHGPVPGLYVSYRESGAVVVLDPDSGRLRARIGLPRGAAPPGTGIGWSRPPDPGAITLSPDGRLAYVLCPNIGGVAVVDAREERMVALLRSEGVPNAWPRGAAPSPDGSRVYVAAGGEALSLFDTGTWTERRIAVGVPLGRLVAARDGQRLYALTIDDGFVVLDTATLGVIGRTRVGTLPSGIALAPSGDTVFVTLGRAPVGRVAVVDGSGPSVLRLIDVGAGPGPLALSRDGASLFVLNTESDSISVIDVKTLALARSFVVPSDTSDLVFSADGSRIFLSLPREDAIAVIDLQGRELERFEPEPPWPAVPLGLALLPG